MSARSMEGRGSRLVRERLGTKAELQKDELAKIVELVEKGGGDFVRWWVLGQPAPDGVVGTISAPIHQAGALLGQLLTLKGIELVYHVFPYGIPNPDGVHIHFETPGGYGR